MKLGLLSSANIACGGHAGDPDTMRATLQDAVARGVRIGAHPGYADPLACGRRVIPMTGAQITNMVAAQVGALVGGAALALALLAISGTALEQAARAAGHPVWSEVHADRRYMVSGQLKPPGQEGAVLDDAGLICDRLADFLLSGRMPVENGAPIALDAHSVCLHGDTPGAVDLARAIRTRLQAEGIAIAAPPGP